jgi:hypothetical protein
MEEEGLRKRFEKKIKHKGHENKERNTKEKRFKKKI